MLPFQTSPARTACAAVLPGTARVWTTILPPAITGCYLTVNKMSRQQGQTQEQGRQTSVYQQALLRLGSQQTTQPKHSPRPAPAPQLCLTTPPHPTARKLSNSVPRTLHLTHPLTPLDGTLPSAESPRTTSFVPSRAWHTVGAQ